MYALLLDVAGEDEGARGIDGSLALSNPSRDATALTIVEVAQPAELSTTGDKVIHTPVENHPVYIPVLRLQWLGENQTALHNYIRALALEWTARAVVVDATGVGAGLASFLERSLPGRVLPLHLQQRLQIAVGMGFSRHRGFRALARAESCPIPSRPSRRHQQEFLQQLKACTFEVLEGAEQRMRWGVPDGARDAETRRNPARRLGPLRRALRPSGKTGLVPPAAQTVIIQAQDPLKQMDKGF